MKNKTISKTKLPLLTLVIFGLVSCAKENKLINKHSMDQEKSTALSATKKETSEVAFNILADINGTDLSGTIAATGAFLGSGTYTETYSFNGKFYQSKALYTDQDGTIEFRIHGEVAFDSETHGTATLTWKAQSGTGIYEDVKGEGTGTEEISNWNATLGTGTSTQSLIGEMSGAPVTSAPGGKNGGNEEETSDTFKLLSFTGTKLQGSNGYSAYLRIDWSVLGEKEIAYYEFQGSTNGTDWNITNAYNTVWVTNPVNTLTSYSQTHGFGTTGSGKKINKDDYFRLKIVYNDGRIKYSNSAKINYSLVWNPW